MGGRSNDLYQPKTSWSGARRLGYSVLVALIAAGLSLGAVWIMVMILTSS